MEQLQSKLHSYSLFGLPKVPQQLSFHQDSWEEGGEEETNLAMEDSWQMLLDDPQVQTLQCVHMWRRPFTFNNHKVIKAQTALKQHRRHVVNNTGLLLVRWTSSSFILPYSCPECHFPEQYTAFTCLCRS